MFILQLIPLKLKSFPVDDYKALGRPKSSELSINVLTELELVDCIIDNIELRAMITWFPLFPAKAYQYCHEIMQFSGVFVPITVINIFGGCPDVL